MRVCLDPHFSKCYREYFGVPPRNERLGVADRQESHCAKTPTLIKRWGVEAYKNEPLSSAQQALAYAQGEPTFASVPVFN